jgi:hypothetical protein
MTGGLAFARDMRNLAAGSTTSPALGQIRFPINQPKPRHCQSPPNVETFLCDQPLGEACSVVVFVVDRALEAAHAV